MATPRAGSSEHVAGLMVTVDVVVVVAAAHHVSWAAVAGPSKHIGRLMCRAERPTWSPHLNGRGAAWPIKFQEDEPRPGLAHRIFRGWAAARPDPSNFQGMGRGPRPDPAHHISNFSRAGPAHQSFKSLGSAGPSRSRPITFSKVSARPGTITRSAPARPGPAQTNGP